MLLTKLAIISATLAIATAAHYYFNNPKDDVIIERVVESVIQHELGMKLDFEQSNNEPSKKKA